MPFPLRWANSHNPFCLSLPASDISDDPHVPDGSPSLAASSSSSSSSSSGHYTAPGWNPLIAAVRARDVVAVARLARGPDGPSLVSSLDYDGLTAEDHAMVRIAGVRVCACHAYARVFVCV